jgi:hypothetical protein
VKVRGTIISRRVTGYGETCVLARLEICWDDDVWENQGLMSFEENSWILIRDLLLLGARKSGIEFNYIDLLKHAPSPVATGSSS